MSAFWWNKHANFGDLLTPWLLEKISGKPVILSQEGEHIVAIGSILGYCKKNSLVWGAGSFGTETKSQISIDASYFAVRGPLTRNMIRIHGGKCPDIFGDPALLLPDYYWPTGVAKDFELGVVIRHSEEKLLKSINVPGALIIYLGTDRVTETIDNILRCKRIATTSLHGLIVADAYGIPNCWIESTSPYGLEHKFHDYFLSVNKSKGPVKSSFLKQGWSMGRIINEIEFDGRKMEIDLNKLRIACPINAS